MPAAAPSIESNRQTLSRGRVIAAAVELADHIGLEQLTIRRLAEQLGVKPMSIYHHVSGKEAIVDGMVDAVFAELSLPSSDSGWRAAVHARCVALRDVLARHPWAIPLMESRPTPGAATLRHHDAMIGCFLRAGFSLELTAHAYAVLDSYVYGFALQQAQLPFNGTAEIGTLAETILGAFPSGEYPHLFRFTADHVLRPGYDFGSSFEVGLDLLLDGIERAAALPS
jgi:AcrR family transcriptional regulator